LPYTLHDFSWNHAIAAGRKIDQDNFTQDVTVYLIEAENLGFGLELSPAIQQASDRVFNELVALIDS
jgi:Ni,Fe-hydrogenase maturation factor